MHAPHRILTSLALAAVLAAVSVSPPARAAAPAPGKTVAASTSAKPVDINAAASDELQSVPGIGKALAQRIIVFREKNGAFQTVDDLLKVQGIGEKSLEKLRPYLTASKAK